VQQIKGTVAELELTSLKTHLRAGIEAKAARGELKVLLPPGHFYDASGQLVMDPDKRVQQAIRSMFDVSCLCSTGKKAGGASSLLEDRPATDS